MKEDIGFEKIGKNIPYEVPEGFFETISKKTLQQIKQRELRKKKIFLTGTIVAAASLAILVSIAFILQRPQTNGDRKELTEQKRIEPLQKTEKEVVEKTSVDSRETVAEKSVAEKLASTANQNEKIDDLLADLSEEDLMQLAALYKADPFNE